MQSQLSLGQRETLARQDAPFLATGLIAGNPQSFEAHLRQAARLMAQTSASPSGRLVRHVCSNAVCPNRPAPSWLGGENIFATVKALSPNKPEIEQILALIDARIGPTL